LYNRTTYNDGELLDAIRGNDEGAFSELFRRYGKEVYRMAYCRVRSHEAAEEMVQNLFLALWDKRATLSITNFSSYFYTAVKNRALNVIESLIVKKKYWDYYKNFIPREENVTERAVEYAELLEAIEKGIAFLPEKPKMVFTLNRLEGRSIQEIAGILNLSTKTVQYHLTRSLKELRLHLKHYIVSWTIWIVTVFNETPIDCFQ
jgi:RNA polymerase sigma-70 factor (ECF subfamily)